MRIRPSLKASLVINLWDMDIALTPKERASALLACTLTSLTSKLVLRFANFHLALMQLTALLWQELTGYQVLKPGWELAIASNNSKDIAILVLTQLRNPIVVIKVGMELVRFGSLPTPITKVTAVSALCEMATSSDTLNDQEISSFRRR